MSTPHTPCAEAVEAAYLTEYVSRAVVERLLTAAFPHLRRQIIAECVEELAVYSCACGRRLEALLGGATTREGDKDE